MKETISAEEGEREIKAARANPYLRTGLIMELNQGTYAKFSPLSIQTSQLLTFAPG